MLAIKNTIEGEVVKFGETIHTAEWPIIQS